MNDETEQELTATGITLGTFDYISPEQARDPRLADTRSDIYSLGCTLFYMLAGQAPFAQGTALQKLLQHQSDRPPDLRSFRSDIPDSVSRVIRRMLAKAPADRHQTPLELIADFAEILEELDTPLPFAATTLPWTMPPRTVPRWRKHALWAAPLAALLLFGLAADRLTRSTGVTSPFPALDASPVAEPSPSQPAGPTTEPSVSPPATSALPPLIAPAPLAVAPAINEPGSEPDPVATSTSEATQAEPVSAFSLDGPLELSKSLWDMGLNWPAAQESLPTVVVGGASASVAEPSAISQSSKSPTAAVPQTVVAPRSDSAILPPSTPQAGSTTSGASSAKP
jgi:serine/threonine-protein kinase